MPITLTLTNPETTPANTVLHVIAIALDYENGIARARIRFDTGVVRSYQEQDADTQAAIRALNTANLTTKSLEQRLIERWVTKGILPAGTVGGSPD